MLHPDAPIKVLGEVVIAAENGPRHRAFSGMALLQNGDLLVVYSLASDHQRTCDGVLVSRRSSDGGATWEDPRPVLAQPERHYSTTHNMTQLSDGRLMLHVWEWRTPRAGDDPRLIRPRGGTDMSVRVLRLFSTDNGRNWSEPRLMESLPPFAAFSKIQWPYGRPHELEDGRLMVPMYGYVSEEGMMGMAVAFSADGGRTFTEVSMMASNPAEHRIFGETDILRVRGGRFLAILREGTPPNWSFRSYSDDDGRTWAPYEQVNFKGHCPCLVQLRSGAILCAYRDVEPGRPGVSVSVSEDDGATWRWVGQLYSGPNRDCAYPVIVRLPDERLFCTYYSSFVDGDCEIGGMWLSDDL